MDTLLHSRAAVRSRIEQLRSAMVRHGIAAVIVPSSDPHLSEYLPQRWCGREWLSGFTGSVGTVVVTADFAGLWVDSRYWEQADSQLAGAGIATMRIPAANSAAHLDWLADNIAAGEVVAVDAAVLSLAAARALSGALQGRGIVLRTDLDILDEVWNDRASLPTPPIYEHRAPYISTPRTARLQMLHAEMQQRGANWHLLSTLDDIAWIFNLRGSDVSYNPVFVAHALVGLNSATLFVAEGKVPAELVAILATDGVAIASYASAGTHLAALDANANAVVMLDPARITLGLRENIPAHARVVETINPSTLAKSRKNGAEIEQVRAFMEQDGAALCEFFCWLENALATSTVTELNIDEHICAARARRSGFVSPSFSTIAGYNANGALPHYRATPEAHATISGDGLLLIDSGGQYLGGTTDITRVVPVGQPSAEQKRDFTLVLKGVIALSSTRFPQGVRSPMLDSIARAPIWAAGVDYGHGTGHGVGYFLNVHEGPQSISRHASPDPHTAMEPGMITSIEPGIYRPGQWGVRIENLVVNQPAEETEFGAFLRFETLTLCPIDTRCMQTELLRADEIAWINAYHTSVRQRLSPYVSGAALQWLLVRTEAL